MFRRTFILVITSLLVINVNSQNSVIYKNDRSYLQFLNDSVLDFSMISVSGDTAFLRSGLGQFNILSDTLFVESKSVSEYDFKIYKELQLYLIGEVKFYLEHQSFDSLILRGPIYNSKKNIDSVRKDYEFIAKLSLKKFRFKQYFFYKQVPNWVERIDENERRILLRYNN